MSSVYNYLFEHFQSLTELNWFAKTVTTLIILIAVLSIAWIGHFITRKILVLIVNKIASRTKTTWDDILVQNKLFVALAHLVPAFIIYYVGQDEAFFLSSFLAVAVRLYFIIIIIAVINSLLNLGLDIYNTTQYAHSRPIKGYIQLVKIIAYSMAVILTIAILMKQDPTALLAGLGAIAAVLILVFKDTILGFVALIQLSANKMVKIGDWIQMPGRGADGSVIDISLNTVKVQNWDKTISTIPTYALVSESFTNWKGMEESGGRRIKRSIHIDMGSIKFCSIEMLSRFEKFELIRNYVREKEQEIRDYNKKHNVADEDLISGRRQTNVGIFRKYLEVYLKQHPKVRQDMTFLIRHLQPTEKGLPIEIYVFSTDIVWANYEGIQADIFDHILAVAPEFELKVYQAPSGTDFSKVLQAK